MNVPNHLKDSLLLRQTGELPARQADELDTLLRDHPGAATFARDARTVMDLYKAGVTDVPPTPPLTLERILREGRRQAAQPESASFWERRRAPLRWAAAVAVTLVSAGAALFFLRDGHSPSPVAQTTPAVEAPTGLWQSFESESFDLQLAQLDTRLNQVQAPASEEDSALDEDSLAEALLLMEQETL